MFSTDPNEPKKVLCKICATNAKKCKRSKKPLILIEGGRRGRPFDALLTHVRRLHKDLHQVWMRVRKAEDSAERGI